MTSSFHVGALCCVRDPRSPLSVQITDPPPLVLFLVRTSCCHCRWLQVPDGNATWSLHVSFGEGCSTTVPPCCSGAHCYCRCCRCCRLAFALHIVHIQTLHPHLPSTHPLNPSPQPIPSLHVPTYAWSVLIDGGPVYQVANDTVAGGEQATQHASLPLLGNDFATASHRPQSRNKRCFFATGTHTHT